MELDTVTQAIRLVPITNARAMHALLHRILVTGSRGDQPGATPRTIPKVVDSVYFQFIFIVVFFSFSVVVDRDLRVC